jgi:hypothetical protein
MIAKYRTCEVSLNCDLECRLRIPGFECEPIRCIVLHLAVTSEPDLPKTFSNQMPEC